MAERCRWAFMSWMEKKLARWPFLGAGNICGDKKLPSTLKNRHVPVLLQIHHLFATLGALVLRIALLRRTTKNGSVSLISIKASLRSP